MSAGRLRRIGRHRHILVGVRLEDETCALLASH
jgi:hypothetical protein